MSAKETAKKRAEIRRLAQAIGRGDYLSEDERTRAALILQSVATNGLTGWLPKETVNAKTDKWRGAVAYIDACYELELRLLARTSDRARKAALEKNRTHELRKALNCSADKIKRAREVHCEPLRDHVRKHLRNPLRKNLQARFLRDAIAELPKERQRAVRALFDALSDFR